jgi:small-conductance mechanosensitive channel
MKGTLAMAINFARLSASFTNLRLKEGVRLTLIVGSSLSIALAGQMAQSRNQEASSVMISKATVEKVTARAIHEAPRPATKLEKFANSQVRTFQEMLDALTERAELVTEMGNVSAEDQARLQKALKEFDENLMTARESLKRIQASKTAVDPFLEEDLKASLFSVQESASSAQGELIGLDQFQGFKVSRTGQ